MWDETAEELLTLVENDEYVDYEPDALWEDYGQTVYTSPDDWTVDGTGYVEQDDGLYYPETETDGSWPEPTGSTETESTYDSWESTDDSWGEPVDSWGEPVDDGIVTIVEDGGWNDHSEGDLWQDYYGTLYTDHESWMEGKGGFSEASDGNYYPESEIWGAMGDSGELTATEALEAEALEAEALETEALETEALEADALETETEAYETTTETTDYTDTDTDTDSGY